MQFPTTMFISFEGIDGSGKTTLAHALSERLRAEGTEVLMLREPGGTEVSEKIRSILLESTSQIVPFAEMLLFSAARRQLCEMVISPALQSGQVVICDRFFDSTIAYQGFGRRLADPKWVQEFQLAVTNGLIPTRTYWVDVPLELAASRRGTRDEDRIEQAGNDFFGRVRHAYATLATQEPKRFFKIDGRAPLAELNETIWQDVQVIFGT